jgi:curved DNA-binding protein CbpA
MTDLDQSLQILGVKSGASREEIKQAYREMLMVWHPDRFPHGSLLQHKAQEKTKEINRAYDNLREYVPRAQKDYTEARKAPGPPPRAASEPRPPPEPPPRSANREHTAPPQKGQQPKHTPKSKQTRTPWVVIAFIGLLIGTIVAFNYTRIQRPAALLSIPAGFSLPTSTISPDRRYGVIAPDFQRYQQGGTQNAIIDMKTGHIIATIDAETEFKDPKVRAHGGHSEMRPRWSLDSSFLLWEVSGKWFPTALVLISIENGVARWQVDLLKTAQQEILSRTRLANPQQYDDAKKANIGNGSAFPDGFTIDVTADGVNGIRMPLPIRATLTSNPNLIDGIPTVEAQLEGTVESGGAVSFNRYHFGPGR